MKHIPCVLFLLVLLASFADALNNEYYDHLGLKRNASDAEIKGAWRKLSRKLHPDRTNSLPEHEREEARQKYELARIAYETLGNVAKRAAYDIGGTKAVERVSKNPVPAREFQVRFAVTLDDVYNGHERVLQIERDVVCPQCRGTGAKDGDVRQCSKCKGEGVVTVRTSMGPGMVFNMQQTCPRCGGHGHVHTHSCPFCKGRKTVSEKKELRILVEKGIPDGHSVVFEGAAQQRPGEAPGNVRVQLEVQKHRRFRRSGNDLHTSLVVSLKEALLGFEKTVTHMDGRKVVVKRHGVTAHGSIVEVPNEGMPHHQVPSEFGSLFVTIETRFPKQLDQQQRTQLQALLSADSGIQYASAPTGTLPNQAAQE